MADFDTGVSGYIHATAEVDVYFPIDMRGTPEICCRMCYYFRTGSSSCALNGEVCEYPQKYVGGSCPLKRVEED